MKISTFTFLRNFSLLFFLREKKNLNAHKFKQSDLDYIKSIVLCNLKKRNFRLMYFLSLSHNTSNVYCILYVINPKQDDDFFESGE